MNNNRLYILLFTDVVVSDFNIYSSLDVALKEYLKFSINETRTILNEVLQEENGKSSSDCETDDSISCTLQVFEHDPEVSQYLCINNFSIDNFQDFIGNYDNIEEYLNNLESSLNNNKIPDEIVKLFT